MALNLLLPKVEEIQETPSSIFTNTEALWSETRILMRIDYKSRNQHRGTLYYRRLRKVQRCLRNIAKLDAWLSSKDRRDLKWQPYLQSLEILVGETRMVSLEVASMFDRLLLQQQLFVPLAITVTAILARIYAILERLTAEIQGFKTSDVAESTVKRKKKKGNSNKRDEIDEIFQMIE